MSAKILVVDDEADIRLLLATLLTQAGHTVSEAATGADFRAQFDDDQPDIVLLDLKLPDADGLDLIQPLKRNWPGTEVIVLTGHAAIDVAVSATKLGAYDFQKKPFDTKAVLLAVERALEHKRLKEEADGLRRSISNMSGVNSPVFHSAAMRQVLRHVERIAPSDVSVLITGESGTGKEVISDLIHALSPRTKGPIIKINCAALPRDLIESELFGSMKGSFTGSTGDRDGLFRQAEGGTLMLDELSEMPIDTQSKLLRVLQEKEVRPVGGRVSFKTNCRILAATNRKTEEAIRDGKLREDLFYRISAITIALPSLRDRRDDILPMANAFLKRYAAQAGRVLRGFTTAAGQRLRNFDWPGNVRQLQNEVQRAVLMCEGTEVDLPDLSITEKNTDSLRAGLTLIEGVERSTILQMLQETGGNKLETARRLGIGRQTLYNKIKLYGIPA